MSFRPTKPRPYATTKDVIARLVGEAGGVKRVAFTLDRSETQVYAYTDPQEQHQANYDQVRRLTSPDATAAAEDLAALAGGIFVPGAASTQSLNDLGATASEEFGKAAAALFRALSDNKITHDERPSVRKGLDDVLVVLVATRNRLMADDGGEA